MYGWRGRIGLIVPHVNITLEPEINSVLPEGSAAHCARMTIPQLDEAGLRAMAEGALQAADQLAEIDADVTIFACTSGSFIGDGDYEQRLVADIAERTGTAATSTTSASVEALRALGATTVSVATPYDDSINQRLAAYYSSQGFRINNLLGLGLRDRRTAFPLSRSPISAIGLQSHETVYRLARAAVRPGADALFISCTNLATLGIIEELERDLGIPVVTANQATIWSAMRTAHITASPQRLGGLAGLQKVHPTTADRPRATA